MIRLLNNRASERVLTRHSGPSSGSKQADLRSRRNPLSAGRWPAVIAAMTGCSRAAQLCLIALLGLGAVAPAWAGVRAWLDREQIALGETVTLNVEVAARSSTQPDFSPLEADFEIVGSSHNTQISLVNGQQSMRTLWAVALEPRRAGVITLPALDIAGEQTTPLLLTVTPAPVGSAAAGGDLFLEVEVDTQRPYVQQQVRYTLRFFYAIALEGNLEEPSVDGARLLRLGGDAQYQAERGGRRYQVVERRFALVPERSGRLSIPAPRFRGRGGDASGLGGMFGGGRRLSALGQAIDLEVRPRPAQAATPWLPAQSMELVVSGDPVPDSGRVGEPLSLALRLSATGLAAEQLPELKLGEIEGARVYPDQESSRNRDSNEHLLGERERRFAIVPQRPGVLQLPAVTIAWWNTQTDREEYARLPARQVRILPANATAAAEQPDAADAPAAPAAAAPVSDAVAPPASAPSAGFWPWLSALLGAAWLATLWLYWRRAAGLQNPARPAAPAVAVVPDPQRRLREALAGEDLTEIARALRALLPDSGAGLDTLAARLDPAQAAQLRRLERCLYAGDADAAGCLADLRRCFERGPRWLASPPPAETTALPPLYS